MVKCLDYLPGWSWVPIDHTRTATKSSLPQVKAGLLKHNQHLLVCTHTHTYIHIWDGAGKDQGIKQVKILGGYEKPKHVSIHANITIKMPRGWTQFEKSDLNCSKASSFTGFLEKPNRNYGKQQYLQTIILQLLLTQLLIICVK